MITLGVSLYQQGRRITVGIEGESLIVYADSLIEGLERALDMKGYRGMEVINRSDPVGAFSYANVLVRDTKATNADSEQFGR